MLIYPKELDFCSVRKLCRKKKIASFGFKKSVLLELLNKYSMTVFIQRKYRNRLMKYRICPITMDKLEYPFVSIKNPNGSFHYYSLMGIVDFYSKSKTFFCPNTKYEISYEKIREISELYTFYYKKRFRPIKKEYKIDVIFMGKSLLNYINNIISTNITETDINEIILPYLLRYLYLLSIKDRDYSKRLHFTIIDLISSKTFKNKDILENTVRRIYID